MLLLFCVLITCIEITARVYDFVNPGCDFFGSDVFNQTNWYTLRWACIDPHLLDWEYSGIRQYASNQNYDTININSHGFRGFDFTEQKSDNTYRIFIVGGSTVFGYGSTSDQTTIPGYLQTEFTKLDINKKVEVINAGVGFATSFEEAYLLKTKLLQYDPDLIIIYDGGNDVYTRNKEITMIYDDQIKDPFKFGTYEFYRTPAVVYKNLVEPLTSKPMSNNFSDDFNSYNYVINNWENNLKKICKLGEENNFKVAIFLQPLLITTEKTLSDDELEMKEWMFATQYNYNMINKELLSEFSSRIQLLNDHCAISQDLTNVFDDRTEPIFYDWIHMTNHGNELISKRIFEIILPKINDNLL